MDAQKLGATRTGILPNNTSLSPLATNDIIRRAVKMNCVELCLAIGTYLSPAISRGVGTVSVAANLHINLLQRDIHRDSGTRRNRVDIQRERAWAFTIHRHRHVINRVKLT